MKLYLLRYLLFITVLAQLFSCQKDEGLALDLKSKPFEFGIIGELYPVIKDENAKSLQIVIPQDSNKAVLTAFFSGSGQSGLLNSQLIVNQKQVSNFSAPVQLTLKSSDNSSSTNWTVIVKTESEALGLGTHVSESKSLDRNYEYYQQQQGSGTFSGVNCGPAVSTMAAQWADPKFDKTVTEARNAILPKGGGWYTSNVMEYLQAAEVNSMMVSLTNFNANIRNCIDRDYLVILCLDMFYVNYNANSKQQTDKFYVSTKKGTGHYIVVKGYKLVDGKLYLEVYDPNSNGAKNPVSNELKGKNRYYLADQLKAATENWWNYAIVVAPKGNQVKLYESSLLQNGSNTPKQGG